MNILKRELKFYSKQTLFWSIGIVLLIGVSFYKVDGLASTPGGMEAMLDSLPAALRVFFGSGAMDFSTASGAYSMIHLYLAITLTLHAVLLGSGIFYKEERDKTYEFLYVKGVKRWRILGIKILAGLILLILLDIVCLLGVFASVQVMAKTFIMADMMPYMVSLFVGQSFFFAVALLLGFVLPKASKASMMGCCIVFVMFLVSMYAKMGGAIDSIEQFSIFHYLDASYVQSNGYGGLPMLLILGFMVACSIGATLLHEHRDLL